MKTRCQASPFATDELNRLIQWPTAVRPWPPRVRSDGRASLALCPARPRQAKARLQHASARPHPSALHFRFASAFLHHSAASEHPPRHCRRSCSAEITSAHRRSIRQSVVLVAPSPPSPPFPPCSAHDFAFGKPRSALRRHGFALAGAPPWPLPWPCFVGAALAVLVA